MTTNAIEVLHGTIAPSSVGSVTVTTALLATDRVAVIVVKNTTSGTPVVSGLGATWTSSAQSTATTDLYLFSATGFAGGGGVITITISQVTATEYAVYVLRSSAGAVSNPVIALTGSSSLTAGGTAPIPAAATASAGSFVICAGWVSAGTIVFPHATANPSTGWTSDHFVTNVAIISRVSAVDETIQPVISSSAVGFGVVGRIAFYDGVVPGTPIENRLQSIYAESLVREGPSTVQVYGVYASALVGEGPSSVRVYSAYLEVLSTVTGTTPPPEGDSGGTWGG